MRYNFLKYFLLWLVLFSFVTFSVFLKYPGEGNDFVHVSIAALTLSVLLSLIVMFFHKWVIEAKFKKLNENISSEVNPVSSDELGMKTYKKIAKITGILALVVIIAMNFPLLLIPIGCYYFIRKLPSIKENEHVTGEMINERSPKTKVFNFGIILFLIIGVLIILYNISLLLSMMKGSRESAGFAGFFFVFQLLPLDAFFVAVFFYAYACKKISASFFWIFTINLIFVLTISFFVFFGGFRS